MFDFESTRVFVGTCVLASTEIVVREPSPALGLFLAQANFALAIGKFSRDAIHRVVSFEEALLGEVFTDTELRRVIELVAVTTNEYDDRIAHMFGGYTAKEAAGPAGGASTNHDKPGTSGYL